MILFYRKKNNFSFVPLLIYHPLGAFFARQVESRFISSFNSAISSNFKIETLNQDELNSLYDKIARIYAESSQKTLLFQESLRQNNNLHFKKDYESKELKSIKKNLKKTYGKLKSNPLNKQVEKEYKNLQKALRSCQRRERYLKELSELAQLERVSKLKNKNAFWRFTKKLKKKRSVVKEVTASPDQLFKHYKSFFMDNESNFTEKQQNINKKVNDFFDSFSKPKNFPFFTMDQLDYALNDIENSVVKGYDSISYSMLKNSISSVSKNMLLFFYNTMLFSSKVPTNLNISIIKPILKDIDKKSDDFNNIRPISISTCFAQIFEKLVLIRSPKLKISHNNQFGFKQKTSCNHALFTLKETILSYTENRTGIKLASLDAEKAFDKVWRNGLFFKLIDKLDKSMWHILKIYYDSSQGTIELKNGFLSELFPITVGVKQGGILSPALFQAFIDELIFQCTEQNIGAVFNKINICIIVYADDIILLSSVDSHLQLLLDTCDSYSKIWRIKFNASKSNIMEFGKQFFRKSSFHLNNNLISKVDSIIYLGVTIDSQLSFNEYAIEKFSKVQNKVFALSFLGLKSNTIPPHLQSFIYKTYCLSQFTYGLESSVLNKTTRDYLSICQNNILRQILGIHSRCHMSKILKSLKIFSFEELYVFSKLCFLNSIKQNTVTSAIFSGLSVTVRNNRSKSFVQDIKVLENRFSSKIEDIYLECLSYKKLLKKSFEMEDGIADSINTCLIFYKSKTYKNILENLIKPEFIHQDDELQELLQYLIITDVYS